MTAARVGKIPDIKIAMHALGSKYFSISTGSKPNMNLDLKRYWDKILFKEVCMHGHINAAKWLASELSIDRPCAEFVLQYLLESEQGDQAEMIEWLRKTYGI